MIEAILDHYTKEARNFAFGSVEITEKGAFGS